MSPLLKFFLDVDSLAEGRRLRICLVLAALQAVIAPMLDGTLDTVRRITALRSAARSIQGAELAGFEGFSLLAILAVIVIGGAVLMGRVAALIAPDDADSKAATLGVGARSLYRMLRTEWRILRRRPAYEQGLAVGFLTFAGLQTAKAVLSFFRWIAWQTVVTWFGLQETFVGRALEAVYTFEGFLTLLAGAALLLVLSFLCGWAIRRDERAEKVEGRVREVRMFRAEHPLLVAEAKALVTDLSSAFHGDLVGRLLGDVASWNPPHHAEWESDLRDSLAEYLADRSYVVVMEVALRVAGARRRIDLVVDGVVAIEIKWQLRLSTEKDRASAQVVDYARGWSRRGPVIVLVVATERPHVDRVAEEALRWNKEFELPAAPILVLSHNRGPQNASPRQLPLLLPPT